MPTTITTTVWNGRSGVLLQNEALAAVILTGGGHIVSLSCKGAAAAGVADVNPLWQAPWPTTDPALRKLACQDGMVRVARLVCVCV